MVLSVTLLLIVLLCLLHVRQRKRAAQRSAERLKAFRLARHAEEEQRLLDHGDMAGIYGDYPPPPGLGLYTGKGNGNDQR